MKTNLEKIDLEKLQNAINITVSYVDIDSIVDDKFLKRFLEKQEWSTLVASSVLGVSEKEIKKWKQGKVPISKSCARLIYLLSKYDDLVDELYSFKINNLSEDSEDNKDNKDNKGESFITLEENIAKKLKGLSDIKQSFTVDFNYGYVDVKPYDETQDEKISSLESEIKYLNNEIEDIESDKSFLEDEVFNLKNYIYDLESR